MDVSTTEPLDLHPTGNLPTQLWSKLSNKITPTLKVASFSCSLCSAISTTFPYKISRLFKITLLSSKFLKFSKACNKIGWMVDLWGLKEYFRKTWYSLSCKVFRHRILFLLISFEKLFMIDPEKSGVQVDLLVSRQGFIEVWLIWTRFSRSKLLKLLSFLLFFLKLSFLFLSFVMAFN